MDVEGDKPPAQSNPKRVNYLKVILGLAEGFQDLGSLALGGNVGSTLDADIINLDEERLRRRKPPTPFQVRRVLTGKGPIYPIGLE